MANYGSLPGANRADRREGKAWGNGKRAAIAAPAVALLALLAVVSLQGLQEPRTVLSQRGMQIIQDEAGRPVEVPTFPVNYAAGTTVSPKGEFVTSAADKALRTQQLAQKSKEKWIYDYQMDSVPVPQVKVNYKAGTTVSPSGEFDYSAMDKAARTQQLAQKAPKQKWVYDYQMESVPVPQVKVDYKAGTTVSPNAEFDYSAMDKATKTQKLALKPARRSKGTMLHGLSGAAASAQIDGYFQAMSKSQYGHNNHGLNDLPSNRATKFERQMSQTAANQDIANYFAGAKPHAEKATTQSLLASKEATKEMQDFYNSMAKSKHGYSNHALQDKQGPKAKRVMSDSAADKDIQEYFKQFAKASEAAAKKAEAKNKQHSAKKVQHLQSLEAEEQTDSENAKQEAGGHYKPSVHCKGGICADDMLDRPLWAKEDGTVPDVNVDVSKSACQEDMDCESSRSPLLFKDGKAPSLARKDSMSTAQADKDIAKYFKKEQALAAKPRVTPKADKGAKKVVEKPTKFGLSASQARKDVNQYFKRQTQKLSAYGVGVEADNAIEVGKAIGVDAQNEESVFEANPAPAQDTIDEVNEAVMAQRNEGYSNGNGEPAEDIEMPP